MTERCDDIPVEGLVFIRHDGLTYLCAVPRELGKFKLELKNGKVIARGENGMTMIVPSHAKR